jgi:hypothetical protein
VSNPWDMRPSETLADYQRFLGYLNVGAARSLAKASKAMEGRGDLAVSLRRLEDLSSEHDWPARADAWDRYHAAQVLDRAEQIMAEARSILFGGAAGAAKLLDEVAKGEREAPPSTIAAARDLLDRCGLGAVKQSKVTHGFSDSADTAVERAAAALGASPADLAREYESRTGGEPGGVPAAGDGEQRP